MRKLPPRDTTPMMRDSSSGMHFARHPAMHGDEVHAVLDMASGWNPGNHPRVSPATSGQRTMAS